MYTGSTVLRVVNVCNYNIGVRKADDRGYNIPGKGGILMMTVNDILYDESRAKYDRKKFAKGMLEIYDPETNVKVGIEELGMQEVPEEQRHLTNEEITAALKGTAAALEAWLAPITDEAELHAIYMVATTMDLSASKLKILKAKMPNKNFNIE